ncbi:PAAR domain-containing protein [Pseudomonas japonica]|uniref:Zn-binding Pro-Ala-Ala-Arg (PAAR) domain-containing protein, incolved in TypeVI secretion n=1 Tax=Pseudomonas japonica TaxID=256466 RepID=A0A239GXE3_9PSED|nr:PAAR domain-containing protein [Pseudomonas japonica]SNS73562.1 Zn-binding Pro-Ala-Ala-Arg (PAAR) domain-containing protein, incolved in TypeVI secretion [Pseudomonas japonica]
MQPIVLLGHQHDCPIHGKGTVTSGAIDATVNGKPIARVGDSISCGAVIQTGSADTFIDGQAVARVGDTTSHGGTLIEGDAGWLVE